MNRLEITLTGRNTGKVEFSDLPESSWSGRLQRIQALQRQRAARILTAIVVAGLLSGCGSGSRAVRSSKPVPVQDSAGVGYCNDPQSGGVVGERPSLAREDRDLNGDGTAEVVVADKKLCTQEGNCHWNLYRIDDECHRYLGTVSAAGLQRIRPRGEDGFFSLRAFWRLTGGGRVLLQEYRFRRGGYRLVEALLCRQAEDDRILCEERGR